MAAPDQSLATLADLNAGPWIDMPLREGVTGTAQYRVRVGMVDFRFVGTIPATYIMASELPVVARPASTISRAIYSVNGTVKRLVVNSAGYVQLLPSGEAAYDFMESWPAA